MSRTEVTVHGLVHEVEIHDLSPSSMYVVGLPTLDVGTKVAVAIISSDQSRVGTLGQVKYALTGAVAARFRVRPGAKIELRDPVSPEDERFAMVVRALANERGGGASAAPASNSKDFQPTLRLTAPALTFLTSAMNQLEAAQTATAAFAGSIEDLDLESLLSMLELGRKSGRLEIERARARAILHLAEGRIVDVTAEPINGDPMTVLDDVLGWTAGQFQLVACEPTSRTIDLGVTELLLEHAQRRDEAKRR